MRAIALLVLALTTACAGLTQDTRPGPSPSSSQVHRGLASWYGTGHHGKRTASGEKFDMRKLTAAHRSLPFGTRVRVTNLRNGRKVIVRINDRGPFGGGRIIDVSRAAAVALGMLSDGVVPVLLEIMRK